MQLHIFFLLDRTNYSEHVLLAQASKSGSSTSSTSEFSIFFVPRKSLICQGVLEEEGVLGDVCIGEFPLYLVPLESDLMSMELDNSFRDLFLDGELSSLFYAAKALMSVQDKFGMFPRIIGKGDRAKELSSLLTRMRKEAAVENPGGAASFALASTFEALVVIDRTTDPISPLCTQLTYEGLIDEVYGIKDSQIELDANLVDGTATTPGATSTKKKKAPLNGLDVLFAQMRDTNFAVVGQLLNKVARKLNSDYEGRHTAKTIPEIKQFVSKLGGLQSEQKSLRLHTGIAEQVMSFTTSEEFNKILEIQQNFLAGLDVTTQHGLIEELIDRQQPLETVLRLLCLESIMSGGLKQKHFEFFKKEVLQTYGYKHVRTLYDLERLDLFVRQVTTQGQRSKREFYSQTRRPLRLIVDDVNEHEPNDISYVYSGYAPLSVRLVQCILQKGALGRPSSLIGWKGFEDVVRSVPGATFDEHQRASDDIQRARRLANAPTKTRPVLVFFLGGITFAEIAALRFMSRNDDNGREIIIASTQIINGNTMMKAIMRT